MSEFRVICNADDVPEGSARMFVIDEFPIGIFNIHGEFFAMDNRCPHAGASLAHGCIENDIVSCRIHDWRFRICDGKYLDQDRPAYNAKTLPVRLVDGEIRVALKITR
jgi:nitrite reductase/ring-hydroxylating ferredoxin subunit